MSVNDDPTPKITPEAAIEAAARSLCVSCSMDPDRMVKRYHGSDEQMPLWMVRRAEAVKAVEAAALYMDSLRMGKEQQRVADEGRVLRNVCDTLVDLGSQAVVWLNTTVPLLSDDYHDHQTECREFSEKLGAAVCQARERTGGI